MTNILSIFRLTSFALGLLLTLSACAVEKIGYEVVATLPHSSENFTQGLLFHEGILYEGTGQFGKSALIRYAADLQTINLKRALAGRYFGEGIAVLDEQIYQLTWQSGSVFIYNLADFSKAGEFEIAGEGWGLTSDGQTLWMSDGTPTLRQLDAGGQVLQTRQVTWEGAPLDRLNELEWIDGLLYANRWYDSKIYLIDPESGEVQNILDLTELAQPYLGSSERVLNGIAWQAESATLWITGKYWPQIYQLKLQH